MASMSKLFDFIMPKKTMKKGGVSYTDSYDPSASGEVIDVPEYNKFLNDIQTVRTGGTSLEIMKELFQTDPDCSAAVNAYLSLSDTKPIIKAYDNNGELSRDGIKLAQSLLYQLFSITDYSLGYQRKASFREFKEQLGYMILLRGEIGVELICDDAKRPTSLRCVDMATVKFKEKKPGEFKPEQETENTTSSINLDIPTFFTARFRQDPTEVYSDSFFTSAINTIAARSTVINDLYRIMKITGFPRIKITVVEEVLKKNAPESIRDDATKMNAWVRQQLQLVSSSYAALTATSAFVHTDSIEAGVLNDKNPGASLQVSEIIQTLDAQNQAGLKVVATVLGRGQAGVNTASTETIVFAKHANAFNRPIEDVLSAALTLAARLNGFSGWVELSFSDVELRPALELENQNTMKQTRYNTMLSLGEITDDEYDLAILGRLRDKSLPQLSGTNFDAAGSSQVDTYDPTANQSPLNKELSGENDTAAKSASVQPE